MEVFMGVTSTGVAAELEPPRGYSTHPSEATRGQDFQLPFHLRPAELPVAFLFQIRTRLDKPGLLHVLRSTMMTQVGE